ncbi:MAG: YeeE/YedE thiosulfate transporter family protein [Pseudomonadales bacterium]
MTIIDALFPLGIMQYLVGGLFIGIAVSFLFITTGLVGGMSSVFTSSWSFFSNREYFKQDKFLSTRSWRLAYAAGLILGALVWVYSVGEPFQTTVSWWQLAIGGFIAGYGARLSNGCTSGHGICGLASLQLPSLLAVIIFLASAMVSAAVVRTLGGV